MAEKRTKADKLQRQVESDKKEELRSEEERRPEEELGEKKLREDLSRAA